MLSANLSVNLSKSNPTQLSGGPGSTGATQPIIPAIKQIILSMINSVSIVVFYNGTKIIFLMDDLNVFYLLPRVGFQCVFRQIKPLKLDSF